MASASGMMNSPSTSYTSLYKVEKPVCARVGYPRVSYVLWRAQVVLIGDSNGISVFLFGNLSLLLFYGCVYARARVRALCACS